MFKLMLRNSNTNQSKMIECDSIEDARTAYTVALTETFSGFVNGHICDCHWNTWKLFNDYEIHPCESGCFPHRKDTLRIISYDEFVIAVSDTGYGVSHYDKDGQDLISFGRTGDKCFVAHLSRNFNQYVPWDVAYQMYLDFLRGVVKCIVS